MKIKLIHIIAVLVLVLVVFSFYKKNEIADILNPEGLSFMDESKDWEDYTPAQQDLIMKDYFKNNPIQISL